MAVHTIHATSALTRSPHLEGLASSRRPRGATRGQEGDARVGPPPTHTSHSPAQLARLAGLSAPPVLNTPIASRRASPSYPLLAIERVAASVADHIVLDELAYPADGHLVWDEEQLLVRKVYLAAAFPHGNLACMRGKSARAEPDLPERASRDSGGLTPPPWVPRSRAETSATSAERRRTRPTPSTHTHTPRPHRRFVYINRTILSQCGFLNNETRSDKMKSTMCRESFFFFFFPERFNI